MSQTLDLIIAARNSSDAAFKQLKGGLVGVQQEAVKTNVVIASSTDKFGKFAAGVGSVSTTLARSAAAFGLPIGPLKALDDVADVAALGLNNMATSAVGLNAATLGVAGAGLAAGAAFGTWLRTFPAISKAADDAAAALVRLFTAQKDLDAQAAATSGIGAFSDKMAASNEAAMKRQVETLRAAGFSTAQILDALDSKRETSRDKLLAGLKEEQAAIEKAQAERERLAEKEIKRLEKVAESVAKATVTWTGLFGQIPNAIKPAETAVFDFTGTIIDLEAAAKKAREEAAALWKEIDKISGAIIASNQVAWNMVEEAEAAGDSAFRLGEALRDLPGILDRLGVSADSALGQLAAGFAAAAEGAMALFAGLASGNPAQIISGIVGIGQAIKGLSESTNAWVRAAGVIINAPLGLAGLIFGGGGPSAADRLNHDLMVMRTEFINSAGGLRVLEENAAAAGVSLAEMWNARTVEEYERAVGRVNAAIALHESAVDKTKEAMERWGITAGDMGAKFAQGMLHEQLAQIYQDFMLLTAAGADGAAVFGTDLSDAVKKATEAANDSANAAHTAGDSYEETLEKIRNSTTMTVDEIAAAVKKAEEDMATANGNVEVAADQMRESILAAIASGDDMASSINRMVQQSLQAGADLPEFMRPMIAQLIEMGLLFDANGDKITDIANLPFTESLEAGVSRLIDKIEDLVNALLGIPNVEVGVSYKVIGGVPAGVGGTVQVGGGPGLNDDGSPDYDNDPSTPMKEGGWFPFRPGGYGPLTVGEASDEAIIPKDKMAGIIAQAMAMSGGGGGQQQCIHHVYLDGQPMRDWLIKNQRVGALTRT